MKPLSRRACLEHTGKIWWSRALGRVVWGRVLFWVWRYLAFNLCHFETVARLARAKYSSLVLGSLGQASARLTQLLVVQE